VWLHSGSWQYFSGIGNDPKNRHFRTVSQGQTYDPNASFIKMWLPQLSELPVEHAHEPWLAGANAESSCSAAYLRPIVPIATQLKYEAPSNAQPTLSGIVA
jgi:deoxyribodipyrimidine photolyase